MSRSYAQLALHTPASYRICVKGQLDQSMVDYLQGLAIIEDGNESLTTLSGKLPDQAALLGVLNSLYNMALPIVSVECL